MKPGYIISMGSLYKLSLIISYFVASNNTHRQSRSPCEPIGPDVSSESLLSHVAQTAVVSLLSLPAVRSDRSLVPRHPRHAPQSPDTWVARAALVSLTEGFNKKIKKKCGLFYTGRRGSKVVHFPHNLFFLFFSPTLYYWGRGGVNPGVENSLF